MTRATSHRGAATPSAAIVLLAAFAMLAGCAIVPPQPRLGELPSSDWSAPLPDGQGRVDRSRWWQRFDDPLLATLVESALNNSPTLEQAAQRIVEARANARIAAAALWPQVDANLKSARGNTLLITAGTPSPATQTSATFDAAWEIDLFGTARNQAAAATARAQASEARWGGARLSLAAEVADAYVGLRACEALVEIEQAQSASLEHTLALTRQKVEAGFESPANGSLAAASAADSRARVVAQRAECDVGVKRLAMLTLVPEAQLRDSLAQRHARLPAAAPFEVPSVPAAALAQRPDLAAAEREVTAAAADVGAAQAERYPAFGLSGSIGRAALRFGGETFAASTWSIAPALTLPLFDAGRRSASVDAARARFEAAQADWRNIALGAVREVEEALVRLDAAAQRLDDSRRAVDGYEAFVAAASSQWEAGVGSLLDLEQARRTAQTARATLVQTQRERIASWLALYKAVGGDWTPGDATAAESR